MQTLPPEVAEKIDRLRIAIKLSAAENLHSLVVYGGLARGRYKPGVSDVNLLVVLNDASAPSLEKIATDLHAAWREFNLEPYIVSTAELSRAAESFPTRFLDIQLNHIVIEGSDPLAAIKIDPAAVYRRAEQELRNAAMRLRRRFVAAHNDGSALAEAISRTVVPVAVALTALLQLAGKPAQKVFDEAADAFDLDRDALRDLKLFRNRHGANHADAAAVDRVLNLIFRAATLAVEKGG